jgi:ribosomal protein S18 acetylase RimI-like enzyme
VPDLEACIALACAAAPERDAAEWHAALMLDIADPERHLVVAEAGTAIIGYGRARLFEPTSDASADTAPRGYYLAGVFVDPGHRRRGVGQALTEQRLDWIGKRAADAWFFANAQNATSIRLHQKLGFREVTRHFAFPGLTFDNGEGILFRVRLHRSGLHAGCSV